MISKGFSLLMMILLLGWLPAQAGSPAPMTWPRQVMITNGDDVDLERLFILAGAFAAFTDTHVVIGLDAWNQAEPFDLVDLSLPDPVFRGKRLTISLVAGSPADALRSVLANDLADLPDLVIAGIGGQINLAAETPSELVEAARTAADFGIPAIAASGLDADNPSAMATAPAWLTRLVRGPLLEDIEAGMYILVQFPGEIFQRFRQHTQPTKADFEPAIWPMRAETPDPYLSDIIDTYPSAIPQWPN